MNFTELSFNDQRDIIQRVQAENGTQRQIIEKDWWVTSVLRALFSLPYSNYISFKGGTSLSKCWHLINRMSEDIDIAIDRQFLGFSGRLSKTQISDKLRRASCSFVRERLQYDLAKQLAQNGISRSKFNIFVNISPITTTDPETIEVEYNPIYNDNIYIRPKVIIEVSGRSMNEPVASVYLKSLIDEVFANAPFTKPTFEVMAVLPQRTFLEKVFLLHEEFAKPKELIRTERMSRHLYDICQIIDTPIAEQAIQDIKLYQSIVNHRRTFIGLKGFDYDTLQPATIRIVPPNYIQDLWEEDYKSMQETMIYGDSLPFSKLIEKIQNLNTKINRMTWSKSSGL